MMIIVESLDNVIIYFILYHLICFCFLKVEGDIDTSKTTACCFVKQQTQPLVHILKDIKARKKEL